MLRRELDTGDLQHEVVDHDRAASHTSVPPREVRGEQCGVDLLEVHWLFSGHGYGLLAPFRAARSHGPAIRSARWPPRGPSGALTRPAIDPLGGALGIAAFSAGLEVRIGG
jgi:hypothetical protein